MLKDFLERGGCDDQFRAQVSGDNAFATAQELASRFVVPEVNLNYVNGGLSAWLKTIEATRVNEPREVKVKDLMLIQRLAENQHANRCLNIVVQTYHSHNFLDKLGRELNHRLNHRAGPLLGVFRLLVAHHDQVADQADRNA
jgi:hypothetical protein